VRNRPNSISPEVCHQVCNLDSAMEVGLKQLIADVLIQVQTDSLPPAGSTARLIRDTHADTVVESSEINVSQMFNFEHGHRCSPFRSMMTNSQRKGKREGDGRRTPDRLSAAERSSTVN